MKNAELWGALGWLALALALGAVEMATTDFIFLMLVGGALAAATAAGLGFDFAPERVRRVEEKALADLIAHRA